VPLTAREIVPAIRCPVHGYRQLVGLDREGPSGDSAPDPVLLGRGAAESACPKRTLEDCRGAAESACPTVTSAGWVEQKRLAAQPEAQPRALARVETALGARSLEAIQPAVLPDGAVAAFPRWR